MTAVSWPYYTPAPERAQGAVPSASLTSRLLGTSGISYGTKGAGETLDYTLDLTDWLVPGDSIAGAYGVALSQTGQVLVTGDLSLAWLSVFGSTVVFLATAGLPSTAYIVLIQAQTVAGRVGRFAGTLSITQWTPFGFPQPSVPTWFETGTEGLSAGGTLLGLPNGTALGANAMVPIGNVPPNAVAPSAEIVLAAPSGAIFLFS